MQLNLRDELKQSFLLDFFKNKTLQSNPLPNDASFRQYHRIAVDGDDSTFILMDCPPEHYSVLPFIKIAEFLLAHDFPVPRIYHINDEDGFLLLEDFGNISVRQYLLNQASPKSQTQIYRLIIDLLTNLQSVSPPVDLDFYTDELLLKELELFTDWYITIYNW
jgi:aminoglycoside/choline kinase family phosphotransferase